MSSVNFYKHPFSRTVVFFSSAALLFAACTFPDRTFDDTEFNHLANQGGASGSGGTGGSGGTSGSAGSAGSSGSTSGSSGSSGSSGTAGSSGSSGASGSSGSSGASGASGSSGSSGSAGSSGSSGSAGSSGSSGSAGTGGTGGTGTPNGPCTSVADCVEGQVCSKLTNPSADVYETSCKNPNATGADIGATCTGASSCLSAYCEPGSKTCSTFCASDAQCPTGSQCLQTYVGSDSNNMPVFKNACRKTCQQNSDCPPNFEGKSLCALGSDLINDEYWTYCDSGYVGESFPNPATTGCDIGLVVTSNNVQYCSITCLSDADCAASSVLTKCKAAQLSPSPSGEATPTPIQGAMFCTLP